MKNKKVIIVNGDNAGVIAATITAYLRKEEVKYEMLDIQDYFRRLVNMMVGTPHPPSYYADKMHEVLPDFFGAMPEAAYATMYAAAQKLHPLFAAKATARQIRFNTQEEVFILINLFDYLDINVFANEQSVEAVLLIQSEQQMIQPASVPNVTCRWIQASGSFDLRRILVRATVKEFMGFTE